MEVFVITVSLVDCHTAGCQSDSIFFCAQTACASHAPNLISLRAPMKTVKGLMYLLIGNAGV